MKSYASATGVLNRPESDPAAERRGVWWLVGSFALCPCHLPLTLAVLGTVLGGTALGAVFREHAVVVGVVVTALWLAGTAYGFRLIAKARAGATCPAPARRRR
jgi:hypothetical protein